MLEIHYVDSFKREQVVQFASREEFERSQQSCLIGISDSFKVSKLIYNGHLLDYQGTYGDIFFYLLKQDLSLFE